MVEIENQLTDFEIYDALEVKSFLPTGLREPTCIDFIRKAFKKNLLQGFLTELNKHYLHCFKQYSGASKVWLQVSNSSNI